METQKEKVHPMVSAYMAKLGRRSQEKNKRTPEQMSELAKLRWAKLKEKNEQLLTPLE